MDQVGELYEHTTTRNTIVCRECKRIGSKMDIDPYDAAADWINEGWRITKFDSIYCPKCANIKLKQK